MYSFKESVTRWENSKKYLAGGEGSSGRSALFPLFIDYGKGSRIFDIDGNEYIDFMLGYGPLIMGHNHPKIVSAIKIQTEKSLVHGYNHDGEIELAKKIVSLIPGIDQIQFNISGTEAIQAALRLARAYTGKTKIIKFMGQYHGWIDNILISGAATRADQMGSYNCPNKVLISKGQLESVLPDVLVTHWNDLNLVEDLIKQNTGKIAAIITEPMMTNSHVILPKKDYLKGLKQLAHDNDILLIFDEVVSGFRIDLRGGQEYFDVTADISVFGKALGGGLPISCLGASKEIMSFFRKDGAIHLGTFNSNPLAVTVANTVVDELSTNESKVYPQMYELGKKLQNGILSIFKKKGISVKVQGTESLFAVMFTDEEINNFEDIYKLNIEVLSKLKKGLYERGIMVRPETRDIWYLSTEHTEEDIAQTLTVIEDIAKSL